MKHNLQCLKSCVRVSLNRTGTAHLSQVPLFPLISYGIRAIIQLEGTSEGLFQRLCDQIGRLIDTLGNFLKPLATIDLPKSPTFLGNFCKVVKIIHFSSETIFGQLLQTFGDFIWSHCFRSISEEGINLNETKVKGKISCNVGIKQVLCVQKKDCLLF